MAWNPNAKAAQGQTGCEVANHDNTIMVIYDNGNEIIMMVAYKNFDDTVTCVSNPPAGRKCILVC